MRFSFTIMFAFRVSVLFVCNLTRLRGENALN